MAQLRGGRGFLPERFNIVAKMEITFQLPCFRVEYIDPLVYSRSRIFSPLKGGGQKYFPGKKGEIFHGMLDRKTRVYYSRITKMQIPLVCPERFQKRSTTRYYVCLCFYVQVSKGTTNSAQSLLLHRFREAHGRDRRVPLGQVTRPFRYYFYVTWIFIFCRCCIVLFLYGR